MLVAVWLCLCLVGVFGFPSGVYGYSFGPTVGGLGPEETVFDWTTERCEGTDMPDQPARAFRDDQISPAFPQGRVQLHFSHHDARRNIGPDLNAASTSGSHDCTVFNLISGRDPDPSRYHHHEWLISPYTLGGNTVYSLVQSEYRAWHHGCIPVGGDYDTCWYNTITLAVSTSSGDQFTTAEPPPGHLVASAPDPWIDRTGPYGAFSPSNILFADGTTIPRRPGDGNASYYYSIIRGKEPGKPDITCLMRTQDLSDPKSWRAWDGSAFSVRFIDPYVEVPANRADHVCKPIAPGVVNGPSESLTYNTYFEKYILVGAFGDPVPGFYYFLSDDLINWSHPKRILERETAMSHQCGDPDPVRDPSLLDPTSTSRNFETTGRRPYLYYKIMHMNPGPDCHWPSDRDQIRIPIEFDPPSASFTVSPNTAQTGQSVSFDGSASSYPGGSITNYQWDLDGDGTFETDTGSTATTSRSYTTAGTVAVKLRVTSSGGSTRDTSGTLTIRGNAPPQPSQPPGGSSTFPPNPAPAVQTKSSAPKPECATVRKNRSRLTRLLRSARRNLARARTRPAKRRYRRQIKSLNRRLKRLPSTACQPKTKCGNVRKKRARLTQLLRSARRKLARAQTNPARRHYRRRIKSLNKRLERLRRPACRRAKRDGQPFFPDR